MNRTAARAWNFLREDAPIVLILAMTRIFVFAFAVGCVIVTYNFLRGMPTASPEEVSAAVLECPPVRKEVLSSTTPLTRGQIEFALSNCIALEFQRSGLPR